MAPKKTTLELMLEISSKHPSSLTGMSQEDFEEIKNVPKDFGLNIDTSVARLPEKESDLPKGEIAILVCMRLGDELIKPDNKTAPCGMECGHTIQYRPYHPDWIKKVCMECAAEIPKAKDFN